MEDPTGATRISEEHCDFGALSMPGLRHNRKSVTRSTPYILLLFLSFSPIARVHAQEPTPAQTPPAQNAPAQNAPGQNPAGQGPGGPQRPEPPPLPPRVPEVYMPDENAFSIGVVGWFPSSGTPIFNQGKANASPTVAALVNLASSKKLEPGGVISVPAGGHNAIRVSYFQTKAAGNFTAATDLNLWSTGFSSGDYMASSYSLRNIKFSYEFLTWPYPIGSRRFRLKTLWQAQYVGLKSSFNAPLSTTDVSTGSGTKNIILPTFGLGVTYYLSRDLRVEANGSGFGIPGHSIIGDADGDLAYMLGRIELRGGGKFFYFRSSPGADYYLKGRLAGAFVGVRVYFR